MSNKQYSIKQQLVTTITTAATIILVITALFLDVLISSNTQKIFDTALLNQALALATLIELDQEGIEFEFADEIIPQFEDKKNPHFFQIFLNRNTVLERSRSLGQKDLPRFHTDLDQHSFHDIRLPDGRPGRLVELVFNPRVDLEDEENETAVHHLLLEQASRVTVTLVLARERSSLEQQRLTNRIIIAGAMLTILLVIAVSAQHFINSGLRPLQHVVDQVVKIDAQAIGNRIIENSQPSKELTPIISQLNNLLDRLEAAFQREKRFSADVAHELRTPLAELKTLSEVGQRHPHDRKTVVKFFTDVEEISAQMQRLVTTLQQQARTDAGQLNVKNDSISLASLVDTMWQDVANESDTNTSLNNQISANLCILTDREKLQMILRNLLTNAAVYSAPGSEIIAYTKVDGERVIFGIANPAMDLAPEDIPMMRERFWRKEVARTDMMHSGLGLSLVEALTSVLGLKLNLYLDEQSIFHAELEGIRLLTLGNPD